MQGREEEIVHLKLRKKNNMISKKRNSSHFDENFGFIKRSGSDPSHLHKVGLKKRSSFKTSKSYLKMPTVNDVNCLKNFQLPQISHFTRTYDENSSCNREIKKEKQVKHMPLSLDTKLLKRSVNCFTELEKLEKKIEDLELTNKMLKSKNKKVEKRFKKEKECYQIKFARCKKTNMELLLLVKELENKNRELMKERDLYD